MYFHIKPIEFDPSDADLIQLWRTLLKNSSSPEKIFQTPEYFDFLICESNTRQQAVLLAIYDVETDNIKGIVPLRQIVQRFDFRLNAKICLAPSIKTVQILGSIPFLPHESELLSAVLNEIFERFHDADAISMAALPMGSPFDKFLCSFSSNIVYRPHVLNGWRDSHIIPLADSFDTYLSRYSAKKRFNLKRQVRLLNEYSDNTLQLQRICRPDQVELYVDTWKQLVPPELTSLLKPISTLKILADKGLVHGYVLTLKGTACGGIYATQAAGTLHIHNIIYAKELARYSVGACILYLAIEDLIQQGQVTSVDLGYSNPAHSDQASNVVEVRGNRLVLRNTLRNRLLCYSHDIYLEKLPKLKRVLKIIRTKKVRKL